MIWGELLVEGAITSDLLRAALGQAFAVPIGSVTVVSSVEYAPETPVVAEMAVLEGEFLRYVGIYLDGSVPQRDALTVARSVAEAAACEVLIPDEMMNPYTMILVHPSGACEEVGLDVEALDEHGEYRVARILSSRQGHDS